MRYILKRSAEIFREGGLRNLMKKFVYYPVNILYALYYTVTIRKMTCGFGPEELVEFIFTGSHGLITPFQMRSEILELADVLSKIKPDRILEIGTATGGTLFLFSHLASKKGCIISVDLPQGEFGGGYPSWRIPLYKSFASEGRGIYLIRDDSHKETTLEKVRGILGNGLLDFLYIDGDHTYQGVKRDFQIYAPLVRRGGLIALHDIAVHPLATGCDVHRFWEEIRKHYRHKEIIKDRGQKSGGIGLLFVEK